MPLNINMPEAHKTLYKAIGDAAGILIAPKAKHYPNVDPEPGSENLLPRMEIMRMEGSQPLTDLAGNVYHEEGLVRVSIIGEAGWGEGPLEAVARQVADALDPPKSMAIPGGGQILINDRPQVRPGFFNDGRWVVRIHVEYMATT